MMSLSCYLGTGRQERNSGLHTNFLSQAKRKMKYEYEYHLFSLKFYHWECSNNDFLLYDFHVLCYSNNYFSSFPLH